MATERPGSPSSAQLGPSVWPSTQYTTASRRPREAISQTAAPQRGHMGAAIPGDDMGQLHRGQGHAFPKTRQAGGRQTGQTGPGLRRGWEPPAGINGSLCACALQSSIYMCTMGSGQLREQLSFHACAPGTRDSWQQHRERKQTTVLVVPQKMTRKVMAPVLHKAGTARRGGEE